jgi:hypothetical protein
MNQTIKIYGEKAEGIKEGDMFVAILDSNEGHDFVRLEKVEN